MIGRSNQPELALEVLRRMEEDGMKKDRMTYGVLMFLHSRAGDWEACLHVNEKMEEVSRSREEKES